VELAGGKAEEEGELESVVSPRTSRRRSWI
jgi:hypothetical protein